MEEKIFKCHSIYTDYEASRCGIIRHRLLKKRIGRIDKFGYMRVTVYNCGKMKIYYSARFIFECHNGLIPPGLVIDHINRNPLDNRIENLRMVTPQQNNFNGAPRIKLQQRRPVIGIMDIEELYFPSICSAGKHYDIHPQSIKHVADNITLAAYSKRFNKWVSFVYQ